MYEYSIGTTELLTQQQHDTRKGECDRLCETMSVCVCDKSRLLTHYSNNLVRKSCVLYENMPEDIPCDVSKAFTPGLHTGNIGNPYINI